MWPPSAASDRPRAADVAGLAGRGVVRPLAERVADRMDRRQVQDVEPHRRDVGQARLDVGEGAVAALLVAARAREQLVPGREARPLAIDGNGERSRQLDRELALGGAAHQGGQRRSERLLVERLERSLERGAIRSVGPFRSGLHEAPADLEVDRDVLARVEALGEITAPRSEAVDPRAHRVQVPAETGDPELAREDVVAQRRHRLLVPCRLVLVPVEDGARDHVVSIGERVCMHADELADRALDREAALVDHRCDRLDDHPVTACGNRRLDGRSRARGASAAGTWQRWHGGHSARVSKATQRCRKYHARE